MSDYCDIAMADELHKPYHDWEYGFPTRDSRVLFERLVLEINQAGLSWALMLKKREAFRIAFANYDIDMVASFGDRDIERLMADEGIIRNRLKIKSVIYNANSIQRLEESHGSFAAWLDDNHPLDLEEWVKLLRGDFKFIGPEIANEFLMSIGYLKGAHREDCPIYKKILALQPPWAG